MQFMSDVKKLFDPKVYMYTSTYLHDLMKLLLFTGYFKSIQNCSIRPYIVTILVLYVAF